MSESIVFFGAGPVAAESLALLAQHTTIEAVITKPQPEHHREEFPVLKTCHQLGISRVLTCTNKQSLSELFENNQCTSRLGVVIDFGVIIPSAVIDAFELGIVNSHFSLLPQWRGADPISFAILSGQVKTGVSLMLINEALDEGDILALGIHDIATDDTTSSLTAYLIQLSDALLRDTLPKYLSGEARPQPQLAVARQLNIPTKPSYSHKLKKEDGQIDWQQPAVQIERQIRAYLDWPKSRADIGGHQVIITKAHVIDGAGIPGVIWLEGRQLGMHTSEGILVIDRLKPAGKQEMSGSDFLLGYKLTA